MDDGDLPATDCPGFLHAGICYETRLLHDALLRVGAIEQLEGNIPTIIGASAVGAEFILTQADNDFTVTIHSTGEASWISITHGDFSGDGFEQLVLSSTTRDEIYRLSDGVPDDAPLVIEYQSFDEFRAPAAAMDLDDGSSLVVTKSNQPGQISAYRLEGATWAPVGSALPGPPAAGLSGALSFDANKDGLRDVVVVWGAPSEGEELHVLVSDGEGGMAQTVFAQACLLGDSGRPHVGDLNGDQIPDLACSKSGVVQLMVGLGDGTFEDPVDLYTMSDSVSLRGCADLDGDGVDDLVLGVSENGPSSLAFVVAPFEQAELVVMPFETTAQYAKGDLDGDGLDELLIGIGTDTHVLISSRL